MGRGGKGTCRLGYETELRQLYVHFKFSVFFFRQWVALSSASSSSCSGAGIGGKAAKELGELELFLTHIAPFYPV
jgi:protein SDA1